MSTAERPTMVPDEPSTPEPIHSTRPPPPHSDTTPPTGTVAWKPPARPLAWSETFDRAFDTLTRRGLRAAIGWWIFKLQSAGKLDAASLAGFVICAVGVEAAVKAWREKRPATAAAVLVPLALAGLGELAHRYELTHAAGYLAAVLVPLAGAVRRL